MSNLDSSLWFIQSSISHDVVVIVVVIAVVQSLSHIQLFETPWTAPHQASFFLAIFHNFFKLMPTESMMPSNHLILYLMMHFEYKLNKQSDNIQLWRNQFPIWSQSIVPCIVLTVVSWPAYRFLRRQIRCSVIPISWRMANFLVCCDPHSQRFYHSQWSRSRWLSGILLLLLSPHGCWQFDLWFLCFF